MTVSVYTGARTVLIPRSYVRGSVPAVIYCHPLGGGPLSASDADGAPGFHRFIHGIARRFPVVIGNLGATGWGNDASVAALAAEVAYATATLGAAPGALFVSTSMQTLAALRYATTNAVRALVSNVGVIDLADVRDFNRPGGWIGPNPQSPFNVNGIDTAWGLPAGSTGDYPTHGASFAALPAGANPNANPAALRGLPHLAFYSGDDPTCIPEITQAHVVAAGHPHSRAVRTCSLGHTDAAVGAAPVDDAIDFLLAHL